MLDIRKRGMLLWHFAVQRVIEQGNLVPHNNLLIRKQHGQSDYSKQKALSRL
ncbi:unnamed protein product [Brassica napus]|uniref:(rape) hypothetical protein n=1 Tax=Brassica napus TaxID=3708 RepID=A0A816IHN1_BRANA|nr:unnamed protein product [Brassica napus]